MNIEVFNPINVNAPRERIYARLGYSRAKTKLNQKQKQQTELYIDQALSLIELKGAALRLEIRELKDDIVKLSRGVEFKSADLVQFFQGCGQVLVMGATSGADIVREIHVQGEGKDITAAVVYDAAASEMTDVALAWMVSYFNNVLRRENQCLTKRRFSAGYGDFSLENQKLICDLIKFNDLGVSVSDNFILQPEKSVTAVAGIKLLNS
ncbi:MAG: methionine synthase [Candidatus Omnitrophota bacterium]